MKSIAGLLVDWDQLKMREPKGRGANYNERRFFVVDQHSILTQLSIVGCLQIPGEPLPVAEMLAKRSKLLTDWL